MTSVSFPGDRNQTWWFSLCINTVIINNSTFQLLPQLNPRITLKETQWFGKKDMMDHGLWRSSPGRSQRVLEQEVVGSDLVQRNHRVGDGKDEVDVVLRHLLCDQGEGGVILQGPETHHDSD